MIVFLKIIEWIVALSLVTYLPIYTYRLGWKAGWSAGLIEGARTVRKDESDK